MREQKTKRPVVVNAACLNKNKFLKFYNYLLLLLFQNIRKAKSRVKTSLYHKLIMNLCFWTSK